MLNPSEANLNPVLDKPASSTGDLPSLMARILRYRAGKGNNGIVNRRHQRNSCSCLATMSIINRSTFMEGIVTEISKGGLKFRPAKVYLLDRLNTPVSFEFSKFRISGKIVATRDDGYGVALYEEISDENLETFLADFSKSILGATA